MDNAPYAAELRQVIEQSTFTVDPGTYVYAKVSDMPRGGTKHFMVTADADEITVVTTADRLSELALLERNKDDYKLIALNVSVPFYCVGFLATVGDALARRNMNVLMVSTYSKDYVMVRADMIATARTVLLDLGFKEG